LGVKKNATFVEIKDCYRFLSKKYHPDKNPGDKKAEEKFKVIASAYKVLKDPERRKMYDLTGSDVTDGEIERKAGGLLQQIFQLIVSQKGLVAINETDMITEMKANIEKGMGELDKNIEVARNSRKAIGKILKRVKHKNKNNPIGNMLRHEIHKHTETIDKSKFEKRVGKKALFLWTEYGFDYEQKMKVNYRVGFGMNRQATNSQVIFNTGV
jgi:DnaJ-class molecular chaperone